MAGFKGVTVTIRAFGGVARLLRLLAGWTCTLAECIVGAYITHGNAAVERERARTQPTRKLRQRIGLRPDTGASATVIPVDKKGPGSEKGTHLPARSPIASFAEVASRLVGPFEWYDRFPDGGTKREPTAEPAALPKDRRGFGEGSLWSLPNVDTPPIRAKNTPFVPYKNMAPMGTNGANGGPCDVDVVV